jgi:hypothetical protein
VFIPTIVKVFVNLILTLPRLLKSLIFKVERVNIWNLKCSCKFVFDLWDIFNVFHIAFVFTRWIICFLLFVSLHFPIQITWSYLWRSSIHFCNSFIIPAHLHIAILHDIVWIKGHSCLVCSIS